MNKTILSTALMTLLSTVTYAENSAPPTIPGNPTPAVAPAQPANPSTSSEAGKPVTTPTPPPTEAVINCKYHIPTETTTIEQSLLSTWSGKAVVQSFTFNPESIDTDLGELKSCYTDQGWQGFNDALQKSGNINAIKTQHLTVSSQVDGDVKIAAVKDNQWKVTVPIQVVYQNDKEKLTQLLAIDLLVGRKISGDLGIMQMIATPRQTASSQPVPSTETPGSTTAGPTPATATPGNPAPNETSPTAGKVPAQPTHP